MENGESLLDVIDDTSDLFGNNDSAFNWADEILAENEAGVSSTVATEHGNLATTIIPSNVIMTSQNYITSSSPSQTLTLAASQHPFLSSSVANSGDIQHHGTAIVGQTIVNPVQNVGRSVTAQLLQQGSQQFILKTAGGQLHLTTQAPVQFQQQVLQSGVHASPNQFQQTLVQSHSNRQSPAIAASASPLQNRSITPGSSVPLPVSFAVNQSHQTMNQLKSASPAPNVNILHLPQVQQLQQSQQHLQIAPGTVLQIPGAAGQQVVNTNLLQGLSNQHQVSLVNTQQGTLVNTQNTVIQNPNVVNLNVAHQLPLGMQSVQTAAPQAPFNIQGTLIQTAEGKSILIPTQNVAHAVNIQSLGQFQLGTQVAQTAQTQPQHQSSNTVANMLKLQAAQSTERPNQGMPQLIVNHQGQQFLIQRAPSAGGQPQNIVVRTLPQGNVVQQTQQRTAQSGTTFQALGGQGQQVKFVQQGTNQATSNVSVNIGGQNVNLGQISLQNVQFVQGNTKLSSSSAQQEQHQVTFQQGQGHDMVAKQQVTSQTANMTSQQNFNAMLQMQQTIVTSANHIQTSASNPINIANQNYKGLSNMQQLMQKLRGNKVVTLQTIPDSNVQTAVQTQPVVAKVTTVAPNVNIFQIKREKIDTSANSSVNVASSGSTTIKQLMLQKQAGTLGTAKIIVKQEPVLKSEASSLTNSCSLASQSLQSAASIEGLLSTSSSLPIAQVTIVNTTVSQSAMSASSNFVSNAGQHCVSSVDIKPDIKSFVSQCYGTEKSDNISSFVNTISPKQFSASQNNSSILSALTGSHISEASNSVTSTTNSLSGNLSSISPQETPTSASQVNGASKPAGGAMLQTIHLPPELQQHFQKVQLKIREVNSDRSLSPADRQSKLQQLNMIQRKILLRGRVLATTRAEPNHIQHGLQALASPPHNQQNGSSQLLTTVSNSVHPILSVTQQKSVLGQQTSYLGQQSTQPQSVDSSLQSGSVPSGQESIPSGRQSVSFAQQIFMSDQLSVSSALQGVLSGPHTTTNHHTTSASHQTTSVHSTVPGHSFLSAVEQSLSPTGHPAYMRQPVSMAPNSQEHIPRLQSPDISSNMNGGDLIAARSVTPGSSQHPSSLPNVLFASSDTTSNVSSAVFAMTNSIMTSVVTNSNMPSVVANSNHTVMVTSSNTTPVLSTGEMVPSQSQSGSPISSLEQQDDSNKAVPTQIKIGNKILTLNLTKQQKDKVQGYLDRMTPEQQQQYLQTQQGILNRIQRQQELNAQIQAQVDAQKKQQLQALQGQTGPENTGLVPQNNIIPGKPASAADSMAGLPSPVPEVKAIPIPKLGQLPGTTESAFRGQKRSFMDIPKGTLINQQLRQDQNLAVNPDTKRAFRSTSDACRRLLRYHVFQSYGPSPEEFNKFDSYMGDIASDLLRKKERMMDKFRVLLLQESMRHDPSAEIVMIQRIQNQELKKLLEEEKKIAKSDPDSFKPMPMKYLMPDTDGDNLDETIKQEPSDSDSSPCKTQISRDKIKTESVSDGETSNGPEYKKMKTLVIRLDSRLNFQSSFKRTSLESRSSLDGSETEKDSARDNMDTSTQEESDDEASNDSVKTEIMDSQYTQENVQEEVVEEEIVTDFNPSERATETLSELPSYSMPLKIRTKAAYKHFDSKSLRRSVEDDTSKTALSVSSADDSQADDGDDDSNENSQNMSPPRFSEYSNSYEHRGNTELASESIYFSQSQNHLGNLKNEDQYSNTTHVEQTRKYLPEHSPVSNDSFDNDNLNPVNDFNNSDYFDNFKMYQPITESLTDSEENSYYSADNTIEQSSLTVDDTENVPWSQPLGSSQQHQYSDSEHSGESDPEVKAQMESAINSILSLNQGAPNESHSADFNFSQSSHLFTSVPAYQSEASDGDSQSEMRIDESVDISGSFTDTAIRIDDNDDDDVVIVGDDIDAAVQSILM